MYCVDSEVRAALCEVHTWIKQRRCDDVVDHRLTIAQQLILRIERSGFHWSWPTPNFTGMITTGMVVLTLVFVGSVPIIGKLILASREIGEGAVPLEIGLEAGVSGALAM